MGQAGLALIVTTIMTAVIHTLIPDHWLPFVLVARTEGWTTRHMILLTTAAALLHVVVSIALGLIVVAVGQSAEQAVMGIAATIGSLAGWVLVTFGLAYMAWFLLRGGHVHSFGMHPHHDAEASPHGAPGEQGTPPNQGARAERGTAAARRRLPGYALAFIVGFNPCILVAPIVYGAAQMSRATVVAVATSFATTTVLTMVGATLIGHRGTSRLMSPFLTRYGEALSGGLIALTGLAVMLIAP